MFKETADIQTADMLKLPVPVAHYHSVVLKPSETQKEMVAGLSERAERVRNKMVDSSVDNMLYDIDVDDLDDEDYEPDEYFSD